MEIKKSSYSKVLDINKNRLKCPNCKKPSLKPFTPFCSKKCSDIDLGKWLSDESFIKINLD